MDRGRQESDTTEQLTHTHTQRLLEDTGYNSLCSMIHPYLFQVQSFVSVNPMPLIRPSPSLFLLLTVVCFLFPVSVSLFCIYIHLCYFQIPHISDTKNICLCRLTYFTKHDILKIYPCCYKWHYFILLMTEQYSIVCAYMYHIFLIQLTIDGHLVCFHFLAVVSSGTTLGLRFAYLFELVLSFSLDVNSGVVLLDHMIDHSGTI